MYANLLLLSKINRGGGIYAKWGENPQILERYMVEKCTHSWKKKKN